jgi:hypothetical protein
MPENPWVTAGRKKPRTSREAAETAAAPAREPAAANPWVGLSGSSDAREELLKVPKPDEDDRGIELSAVGYAVDEPPDDVAEPEQEPVAVRRPRPPRPPRSARRARPTRAGRRQFSVRRARRPLAGAGVAAAIAGAYALGAGSVPSGPVAASLRASAPVIRGVALTSAVPRAEPAAVLTRRARAAPAEGRNERRQARPRSTRALPHAGSAVPAARGRVRVVVSYRAPAVTSSPPAVTYTAPVAPRAYTPPAVAYSPPVAVAASVTRAQTPAAAPRASVPAGACYPGELGC